MAKLKTGIVLLNFTDIKSAAQAKTYYKDKGADYWIKGESVESTWGGKGCVRLGLAGKVDPVHFDRLIDNLYPIVAAPLTLNTALTVKNVTGRKVAIDITFHVPKAVSILAGLVERDEIEKAASECVDEVMVEIERDTRTRVRLGGEESETRVTGELTWAKVMHRTSRPVDGVPDPLLHFHVLAFNGTWDPVEERWKALDIGAARRDATYYEALYAAKLAARMRALGFIVVRSPGGGWTIANIDPDLMKACSRRTEQVEKEAIEQEKQIGPLSTKQLAALGRLTRSSKGTPLSAEELRTTWRERLKDFIEPLECEYRACATRLKWGSQTVHDPREVATEAVSFAIKHLEATNSAWRERQFLALALHQSCGACSPDEIFAAAKESGIIRREIDDVTWCTTVNVMREERALLQYVQDQRGTCPPLVPDLILPPDSKLSPEQLAALSIILSSQDRVVGLHGRAGVGKSTLLTTADALLKRSGRAVVALAPTKGACEVLAKDGFNSVTLQLMLKSKKEQGRLKDALVVVDEAGLVGTGDLKALFDLAEMNNARIVLVGDTGQHNSVARGDALRLLIEHGGLQCADVRTIRRQRSDDYKAVIQDLSNAQHDVQLGARGLDALDKKGWIREEGNEDRYTKLATEFVQALDRKVSTLVIAPTHAEINEATVAIRQNLLSAGRLGIDDHTYQRLTSCNLSEAERGLSTSYRPGHVVEFLSDVAGLDHEARFERGQRVKVLGPLADGILVETRPGVTQWLPLNEASRHVVYSRDQIELRVGDRVRMTKNMITDDDPQHILPNGSIHAVAAFKPDGSLVLDNGATVSAEWGHLSYGWACTSIGSQGTTVDHVFVVQSAASGRAANLAQLYVSLSRGRDQATVFTDDKDALYRAAGRSSKRLLATELLQGITAPLTTAESYRRWDSQNRARVTLRPPVEQALAAAANAPATRRYIKSAPTVADKTSKVPDGAVKCGSSPGVTAPAVEIPAPAVRPYIKSVKVLLEKTSVDSGFPAKEGPRQEV